MVPASATVRVDVRVTSLDEAQRVDKEIAALAPVDPQADDRGQRRRQPLRRCRSTPASSCSTSPQQAAPTAASAQLDGVSVGGGSDGNFTAALGVPTLDGLGVVGGGAHADHEWVDVASIPNAPPSSPP